MDGLLVLIASNNQLQAEQSVMTNLSFALDSMTREIRTGSHYYCDAQNNAGSDPKLFQDGNDLTSNPGQIDAGDDYGYQDCSDGNNNDRKYNGLAFIEGGQSITGAPNTRIVYYFDNNSDSPNYQKIMRRLNGESAQPITSSGIVIDDAEFYVTGSKPQSESGANRDDQPTVTIFIEAHDKADTSQKKYRIQTTITQRALDI